MPYLVAAIVGVALAFVELDTRLQLPRGLGWRWWIARLALEGAAAALAWPVVEAFSAGRGNLDWLQGPIGWITAAGVGLAFLRLRILDISVSGREIPFGPAAPYELVCQYLESRAEACGIREQTRWLERKAYPLIPKRLSMAKVYDHAVLIVKSLRNVDPAVRREHEVAVRRLRDDTTETVEDRTKSLLQYISNDLRSFGTIQDLLD